ncbi:hypothetical protein E4U57_003233 [Claviceps arundinis]|uniref:Uncharacterized protein n=1 Tax=Claviceps arundinis TaxID=1623583 RepID=A0ABQ7P762_9HYPO|nr:hypothetical protein E4U57_003233 [Claviceps arundinis]
MAKQLTTFNGPGIAKVTTRFTDGVETANRLCNNGIIYESEIFDAEPYNTAEAVLSMLHVAKPQQGAVEARPRKHSYVKVDTKWAM